MTIRMTYRPKIFTEFDRARIDEFIVRYPLAAVQSLHHESIATSMAPVWRLGDGHYYFHLARANPHAEILHNTRASCLFTGPNGYVSARFYQTRQSPPTWNYVVATLSGTVEEVCDAEMIIDIVEQFVGKMEGGPWQAPQDMPFATLLRAIRVFRLTVTAATGHFKLSQNKSLDDRAGVIRSLEQSESLLDQDLAGFMADYFKRES